MTDVDDLVEVYREFMAHQGTPANTVAGRLRTLRNVGAVVGLLRDANREQVEAWWITRSELAPATRVADLANLRSFYKWAIRWEHRVDDPTTRLDPPKKDRGTPGWVSKPDLQKLLETLPPDLARAVCLGAYAGLRVSEAASLHWSQIDRELGTARVFGKGQKYRVVAISPLLVDKLLPDTGGNVVTATPTAMSGAQLQRRVNRAIRAAGVDATFHKLRHRYGMVALNSTGNIEAVAKQMGHSSIVTTTVYATSGDEVARKIADAVMR